MNSPTSVIVTAGYDGARHVLALVELLRREGIKNAGLLVVSPFTLRRFRQYVGRVGWKAFWQAVPRALGISGFENEPDAVGRLLRKHSVEVRSLRRWARRWGVPYRSVRSLNNDAAVKWVAETDPDWIVYGGGGILHRTFIDAAERRILNAHSGPLPEVRGMNAAEWTLLLGLKPTVTAHIIDEGIDTGGVVAERAISLDGCSDIFELRSRHVAEGVKLLLEVLKDPPDEIPLRNQNAEAYRQCFVLAPAMKELVTKKLEVHASSVEEAKIE